MKSRIYQTAALLMAIILFGFTPSQKAKTTTSVILKFNNFFNNEPLSFDKTYTNIYGEQLSFRTLNYFISNIKLTLKDGSEYIVPQDSSYFLVKQGDENSKQIILKNLPAAKYKSITFMVGIDSVRNTMDISRRTGTLDVGGTAKGMYWAWNSGYIFFKMEGKSPAIPDSVSNNFFYHIGGFGGFQSTTINNIRTKVLDFEKPVSAKNKIPVIGINVNVDEFFNTRNPVKLTEHPNVMWGALSVTISENYISTFRLGDISYLKGK